MGVVAMNNSSAHKGPILYLATAKLIKGAQGPNRWLAGDLHNYFNGRRGWMEEEEVVVEKSPSTLI